MLNETADLKTLFDGLSGPVNFNLSGIERANSIGIHRWISQIVKFTAANSTEVSFVSYPLAIQANVIINLFGSAAVTSCLAPYYCGTCDADKLVVVTKSQIQKLCGEIPNVKCPVCGGELAFDELPTYFDFLKSKSL